MIRVLVVEDSRFFDQSLEDILEAEPELKVVGVAKDGLGAITMAARLKPDVITMGITRDMVMPRLNGLEATRFVIDQNPGVGVIILSTYGDDEYVFEAIKAGARGYLLKGKSSKDLIEAIRAVHRGEAMLEPVIANKVLAEFRRLARDSSVFNQFLT